MVALACTHVASARADFTEDFCSGGSPAAPWTNGLGASTSFEYISDGCLTGSPGLDEFVDSAPVALPADSISGAAIAMPPGEVLTGASLSFHSEDVDNGAYVALDFDADGQQFSTSQIGDDHAGTSLGVRLPDATQLGVQIVCINSSPCDFAAGDIFSVGATALTIHDTGTPTVAATGGSLDVDGATVKGIQDVLYHATDVGSGVQSATVSLGPTVVGTTDSSCESASLTPCPATVDGTISANTALVPDGVYPVILTATDVSGDADPVQIGTVTVANDVGTTSVNPSTHLARAIRTKVTFDWDPRARSTRLIWTRFGRLPAGARVTVTCAGAHCPFHRLTADAHDLRALQRHLRDRSFRTGQRLTLTISAPHRRSETGTFAIRAHRLPTLVHVRRTRRPTTR